MLVSLIDVKPIRVFRSSKLKNSSFAPSASAHSSFPVYRYDGLHMITAVEDSDGQEIPCSSLKIPLDDTTHYIFVIERCSSRSTLDSAVLRTKIATTTIATTSSKCAANEHEELKAMFSQQQKKKDTKLDSRWPYH